VIVAGVVCASAGTVQINRNTTRVATIVERSGPATEEDRGQGGQCMIVFQEAAPRKLVKDSLGD